MSQPIICLDKEVRHFAEHCGSLFPNRNSSTSVPVLLGLVECEGRRTLLREVGAPTDRHRPFARADAGGGRSGETLRFPSLSGG